MKLQLAILALAAGSASALQGTWQQCGGESWNGGTVCAPGNVCVFSNSWYSQCLPGTSSSTWFAPASSICSSLSTAVVVATPSSSTSTSTSTTVMKVASSSTTVVTTTTTSKAPVPTTTTISKAPAPTTTSAAPAPTSPAGGTGVTYKASFTHYGSGDTFGSPNCQTNTCACGFFTSPGFAVAASQNLYGVGPGAGAGPACGTCWKITGETDSSGNQLANAGNSIVVMINNLCPAQGNPLCSQSSMTDTNQYGANVNFDLCSDSGAAAAFFPNGVGLALGTVTQVSCSGYSGTVAH